MAGELVTEVVGAGGGRRVSTYLPMDPPTAIVFAGDGELVAPWGVDLEAAGGPATMLVGAHRASDEAVRLHEYSPGFDPDRFAAHERFFVGDLRRWVRSRFGVDLPADRTAVFGVSAGAELALAVGLRHPGRFGTILAASPGAGFRPPGDLARPLPRTYLVAGNEEPFFAENATRWADALAAAGADVVLTERPGGHGDPFWREELPRMAAWAFEQPDRQ